MKLLGIKINLKLIGWIGGIVALLIVAYFTEFFKNLFNADIKKIEIESVVLIKENKSQGVDIVVKNLSDKLQNLTSLGLVISKGRQYSPDATVDKTVYRLSDRLTFKSEGKEQIIYQAEGELRKYIHGGWGLNLIIPIREELEPQKTRSIILFLPEAIKVNIANSNFSGLSDIDNAYISGNPPNKIRILDFLKSEKLLDINILLSGSTGNTIFKTSIDFNK